MKLDLQLFAVPARRVSKTRKNTRRANLKVAKPTITKCTNCGEVLRPHRACTKCGFYKGSAVLNIKETEE